VLGGSFRGRALPVPGGTVSRPRLSIGCTGDEVKS
jgi:hypothetical protein